MSIITPPRGVSYRLHATDWQDSALCRDDNPELWFSTSSRDRRKAIALCQTCPVIDECGREADRTDQRYGVWAGVDRELKGEGTPGKR